MNVTEAVQHLETQWVEIGEDPDYFDAYEYALEYQRHADSEGDQTERALALVLADARRRLAQRVAKAELCKAQDDAAVMYAVARLARLLHGTPRSNRVSQLMVARLQDRARALALDADDWRARLVAASQPLEV